MRILFVVNTSRFFVSHRFDLAKHLVSKGFDVFLATHVNGDLRVIREAGIGVFELSNSRTANIFGLLKLNREISNIIKNGRFDASIFVSLRLIICCYINFFIYKKRRYVFIISGLGSLFSGFKSSVVKGLSRVLVNYLLGFLFRCVHSKIIVQNEDDLWLFRRLFQLDHHRLIKIQGSGLRIVKSQLNVMPKRNVIVMASRLLLDKGVKEFVDSVKTLPPEIIDRYDFLLFGDFDLLNPAAITQRQLCSWLESSPVKFKGYSDDLSRIFDRCLVTILPSYREGLPKSVLDAASFGCAAIVSDAPGCREIVIDGETGFLIRPRDSQHLGDALKIVCENPDKIKLCGLAASTRARESFHIATIGQEFETLLRSGFCSAK